MNDMSPRAKAEAFAALHQGKKAFVLPNCWDGITAKLLERAGFPAIATASAAIAWASGVMDGEKLTRGQMVDAIARVVRSVVVPVSADIEKGYGDTPAQVAETVMMVLDVGAVGVNIEDGMADGRQRDIADMRARIRAARRAADTAGIPAVINARMDGYLLGLSGDGVFKDTLNRAVAWLEAGANSIFVPGVTDRELIARLAAGIDGPLNVLVADENTPSREEMESLGVKRISLGPRLIQATMGDFDHHCRSMRDTGDFRFLAGAPGFSDLNGLF